ncbi:MAG: superoxide dismutase [Rikenellaceae bacterium]|nr:superoxide dismutase [Rikenellaceae bacterium]
MNTSTKPKTQFTLPALPYSDDALAPQISAETLHYHHGHHHQTYVNNLNLLIADTPYAHYSLEEIVLRSEGAIFNNAAQVWNHTFYFDALAAAPQPPTGEFAEAVERDFGSLENLKSEMLRSAVSLFGSGWVWLTSDKHNKLSILPLQNAGNPLTHGLMPLLAIDVWEHAYYIDYRNRRADSVAALWDKINWAVVSARFAK